METALWKESAWTDERRIAAFVRELYSLGSVEAIAENSVQKLDSLIGGRCAIWLCDAKTRAIRGIADTIPELRQYQAHAREFMHQHPRVYYGEKHPCGPPLMIKDFLSLSQWQRTEYYNEVLEAIDS